jgi:hypothetical protein
LIVFAFAALILAGCSEGGGNSSLRARINNGAPAAAEAATPAPTPAPTETPDFSDAQPVLQPTPAPVIVEVTRLVPATVQVEVTRQVINVQTQVIVVTPQPAVCDPRTPAPTIALDATDVAAGVVLRGQWWPCASQTAVAAGEVRP